MRFIRYEKEQCKIICLLSALLIIPLRNAITTCLSSNFPISVATNAGHWFCWGMMLILFSIMFSLGLNCKRDAILLGVFLAFNLLLFVFRRPEEINDVYVSIFVRTMLLAFPYYVIARNVKDYKMLERILYSTSYIINILILISMQQRIDFDGGYSLGTAYAALPSGIVSFRMFLRKSSLCSLLNAGISFFELIYLGARGPIVCYVLFCIYELVFNHSVAKRNAIKALFSICFIVITVVGSSFAWGEDFLLHEEMKILVKHNRLFSKISNQRFFMDSPRKELREAAWEALEKSPLWGTGLLEDRMQIFLQRVAWHPGRAERGFRGNYSHFLFLDWILEYGVIVGGTLSMLLIFYIYKLLFLPYCAYKSCMEIFIFAGIIPLFFSMVWHERMMFYIFLGMAVSGWRFTILRNSL